MHVLRPWLRPHQLSRLSHGLETLRSLPFLARANRTRGFQRRAQHDVHGPHKEYFQIPGQEPKPDLSLYIREPHNDTQSQHVAQYLPAATRSKTRLPPTAQTPQRAILQPPSEVASSARPFIRSTLWFLVFLQLGVLAGTALVTWEYLSPPFEPGSPEEQGLVEEILNVMDTSSLVEDLRENEWFEVDAFTPDLQHGLKGRNLVHQVLGGHGAQGVFMKVFHHPRQDCTMLVLFFGFGVEGWPDMIHGGIIATLFQESLSKHIAYFHPNFHTTPDSVTKIDYKQPCKPGEIYGILVTPSMKGPTMKKGNVNLTQINITSMLLQLGAAPAVTSSFNPATNTESLVVDIRTASGRDPTHAICQAEVKLISKQLEQDADSYGVWAADEKYGGFGRAMDILKKLPEFQYKESPPRSEDADGGKESIEKE